LLPVALVLTVVRALLTPLFLNFEYDTPNFPPDSYGFTKEDRLYWSRFAVDYLLNPAGISYLGDLRFKDGSPVYNERELSHMVDVKNTVQVALRVWVLSLALLLGLGVWAWRGGWLEQFRQGVVRGSWLTVFFLVTILLFVLFAFGGLFVTFHNIFFKPGTWTFFFSDTLIRLFPERFWRDIFILVGTLALGGALALIFLLRKPVRNSAPLL
jgi:integral membrane protein (TIGR01906 family)